MNRPKQFLFVIASAGHVAKMMIEGRPEPDEDHPTHTTPQFYGVPALTSYSTTSMTTSRMLAVSTGPDPWVRLSVTTSVSVVVR